MTSPSNNTSHRRSTPSDRKNIAIRAPEYWPRPAFVTLALHVDVFVLADTFQYSRQSFHNRARLRNPNGWQWISVPLTGGQHGEPIRKARINNTEPWQRKHWRALEYNYRSSPYFEYYEARFAGLFERDWETLGLLSCRTVELVFELIGCEVEIARTSSMAERPDTLVGAFDATVEEGDATYWALPDAAARDRETISSLHVVHTDIPPYKQNFDGFEGGMSVLDLLFNYGPATRQMLLDASRIDGEGSLQPDD